MTETLSKVNSRRLIIDDLVMARNAIDFQLENLFREDKMDGLKLKSALQDPRQLIALMNGSEPDFVVTGRIMEFCVALFGWKVEGYEADDYEVVQVANDMVVRRKSTHQARSLDAPGKSSLVLFSFLQY